MSGKGIGRCCVLLAVVLMMGGGCKSRVDLLKMKAVTVQVQEADGVSVHRVKVSPLDERGLLVTGELVADGTGRGDSFVIQVVLEGPGGDVIAETSSPKLEFKENAKGAMIPKRSFSIPLHSRGPEGSLVRLIVTGL